MQFGFCFIHTYCLLFNITIPWGLFNPSTPWGLFNTNTSWDLFNTSTCWELFNPSTSGIGLALARFRFLNKERFASRKESLFKKVVLFVLQEMIATCVLFPTVSMICDPDYVNQTIAWLVSNNFCNFRWSLDHVAGFLLTFQSTFARYRAVFNKVFCQIINQSEVKPNSIMTYSQGKIFPCLAAVYSDWLIGLSTSVVIGQSDNIGLGFTTLS